MTSTVESNVRKAISRYEELCARGSAQGDEAWGEFIKVQNGMKYMGMEYNTVNCAMLGSKKALKYIKDGYVPGYRVDEAGNVQKLPA